MKVLSAIYKLLLFWGPGSAIDGEQAESRKYEPGEERQCQSVASKKPGNSMNRAREGNNKMPAYRPCIGVTNVFAVTHDERSHVVQGRG